jgi:hypothetical protein
MFEVQLIVPVLNLFTDIGVILIDNRSGDNSYPGNGVQ